MQHSQLPTSIPWPYDVEPAISDLRDHLFAQADALPLPVRIAILSQDAIIIDTNQTWKRIARQPGVPSIAAATIGQNYLEICRQATGAAEQEAHAASDGIRGVLDGALPLFMMEYRCMCGETQCWFMLHVVPLPPTVGGVIIQHLNMHPIEAAEMPRVDTVLDVRVRTSASRSQEANSDVASISDIDGQVGALMLERDRLLAERESAHSQKLAALEATRQMELIVAMASHEIRTPLTIIKRYQQLAEQWLGPRLPSGGITRSLAHALVAARQALEEAQYAAGTLSGLLDDLHFVSRAKTGALRMYPRQCDLNDLVLKIVQEQRQVHPERNIRLWLEHRLPTWVEADADRMRQVLVNYLNNAIQYSPVDQRIDVSVRIMGNVVRVAVRDHGPGLADEEQTHVWDCFFQVARSDPLYESVGGLGLGLYISKYIIERHQGAVGVESTPGNGATFWFSLPLVGTAT